VYSTFKVQKTYLHIFQDSDELNSPFYGERFIMTAESEERETNKMQLI